MSFAVSFACMKAHGSNLVIYSVSHTTMCATVTSSDTTVVREIGIHYNDTKYYSIHYNNTKCVLVRTSIPIHNFIL